MVVERKWQSKKDELALFLDQENVDVLLVQETLLEKWNQFRIGGFAIIIKDKEGSPHGGVAILTRSGRRYQAIPLNLEMEAAAIETVYRGD
ncbi:hypothetical protein Trydic_g637 [Trypoxylus dichotomus]